MILLAVSNPNLFALNIMGLIQVSILCLNKVFILKSLILSNLKVKNTLIIKVILKSAKNHYCQTYINQFWITITQS